MRWNLPQYWRADTPDDRKLVRALSTTGLVDELERAIGPYANGADETLAGDRTRAAAAAWLLRAKKPRFATVYLTALDHSQHTYGPFSKDALATLEGIDEAVGQIREAAGPDATLCVVSDHGFLDIQKEIAPNAVLAKAGLIDLKPDGSVVDWQASAWVSGGTAAILARGAEAAQKARAAFGDLEGLARIIEAAELKSAEGYPDAAFVLAAARGYAFSGNVTGAPVRNSVSRAGRTDIHPRSAIWTRAFSWPVPASGAEGISAGSTCGTSLPALRRYSAFDCRTHEDESCWAGSRFRVCGLAHACGAGD